jgi:acyl-homoserine lactone acylase PvdQ
MAMNKCFLFSATIPVILSAVMYYYMSADLLGGDVEIRGSFEDIDIYSLDFGYKVVEAKTYNGAMYGLGFVHARDRLW